MFLVGLISWWYGRGWKGQLLSISRRFKGVVEFFSIEQLFTTLFAPFRQISAGGSGDTTLGGMFRSGVDQLISRIIGFIIRFFTIIFGMLAITFQAILSILLMTAWWFVPLLPIAGFIMFAIGWVPAWR